MDCPKCAKDSLKPLTIDEIEVDCCTACEGIWFDRAELGRLLDRETSHVKPILGGEDDDAHDYQRGTCPRDGGNLLRVKSLRNREITVDTCPTCHGLWLDGGEFRRIKEAQPSIRLGDLV